MQVANKTGEHFGNVLIIGLGMIGGSFAKALRERGLAYLYGADRRIGELTLGISHGVIDAAAELDAETIAKMDVIVLATPVRAMESVMGQIKPHLRPHTLVTDVGSTKGSVAAAAQRVFGQVPSNFIPSHPIAGAEKSGVLAANPNLFERHMAIITPMAHSNPDQLDLLYRIWRAIGADVVSMDVEHHDHVLAASSHLPHLLAYTLVDALANAERSKDIFRFAAGGFRDFTRIASSDPTMWRDVFLANKEATLSTLDLFTDRLADMRTAIENEDGAAMFGVFTRAKSARDHFLRLLEQRKGAPVKEQKALNLQVRSGSVLEGEINLPADKYLSHIALIMTALADGVSTLNNVQLVGDLYVTAQALRDMGVIIEECGNGVIRVFGVGRRGLRAPIAPVNIHESQTSLYFLLPALAVQSFHCEIIAEGELLLQPQTLLLQQLRCCGVSLESAEADCLPLTIVGGLPATISTTQSDPYLAISQVLLNTLSGNATSAEQWLTVDPLARQVIESFVSADGDLNSSWLATELDIPADPQLVLWTVLTTGALPGSQVVINNVGQSQVVMSLIGSLREAGMQLEWDGQTSVSETSLPLHRLVVRYSRLQRLIIDAKHDPKLQAFLPMLLSASAFAEEGGVLLFDQTMPYYFEDRLTVVCDGLRHLGAQVERTPAGISMTANSLTGGQMDSAGDLYVVLALLLISARAAGGGIVQDCRLFLEEFPGWEDISGQLGFQCQLSV